MMGGNALPLEFMTRRRNAREYEVLCERVHDCLTGSRIEGLSNWEIVRAYRKKESFGDMDIVLCLDYDCDLTKLRKNICDAFGSRAIFTDGLYSNQYGSSGPVSLDNIYSICFSNFQLDFILTRPNLFEAACDYFAWNDLGNLLGRVAHKFGFKLGHKGLVYPFRDGDYMFEEIIVETDWNKILPWFGYDPARFQKGFDTQEEIFEYAASGWFFNPSIYLFDNRNAKSRYRDQKRKTYQDFLTWCKDNNDRLRKFDFGNDKKLAFNIMKARIGREFSDKYEEVECRFNRQRAFKAKFNGEIVMKLTGLEGPELGKFMHFLRHEFPGGEEKFKDCVLLSTDKLIADLIVNWYAVWKEDLGSDLNRSVNLNLSSLKST